MTNETRHPYASIRDGRLKATIWRNESDNGVFFSVELSRTYTDDEGRPQDTNSFSGSDLLRVARLANKAYDLTSEAKAQEKRQAA